MTRMRETSSVLARLVPKNADFLKDHWNRSPAVTSHVDPSTFDDIVTAGDIDSLLTHTRLRPPYLRLTGAGRPMHVSRYTRSVDIQGTILEDVADPAKISREFQGGATISLDAVEDHLPSLATFCREVGQELRAWTESVAFITPAATAGLTVHHDNADVFVLQLSGSKSWTVFDQVRPLPSSGRVYRRADLGEPSLEVELQAGQSLYIPWGAPHYAVATGSASCNVSLMVKQPTARQVLNQALSALLSGDEHDGLPALPLASSSIDEVAARREAALDKLRTASVAELSGGQHHEADDRFTSGVEGFLTALDRITGMTCDSRVIAADDLTWMDVHDYLLVGVGHLKIRVPRTAEALIHGLSAGIPIQLRDVQHGLPEPVALGLLRQLARQGAVSLVPDHGDDGQQA